MGLRISTAAAWLAILFAVLVGSLKETRESETKFTVSVKALVPNAATS